MRRFQTQIGILLCALSAVVIFVTNVSRDDASDIVWDMWLSRNPLVSWIGGNLVPENFWFYLLVLYALLGALSFYVIRFFVRIIRYIHNKTRP